jgi:DTW domain-containing protein YfiP
LVYPAPGALPLANPRQFGQPVLLQPPQNLIFIDASWRKARKIWYSTPLLQRLDCIRLVPDQASRYRIRKAPNAGYLSTAESIAFSMGWLENNGEKYRILLDIFDVMVERQIYKMGLHTYKRNYLNHNKHNATGHEGN